VRSDVGPVAALPLWVITHRTLSHGAVRLLALILAAWTENGCADPTRQQLAADLRLSPDSVDRWMRDLVRAGALEVEGRHGRANTYTIRLSGGGRIAADSDTASGTHHHGNLLGMREIPTPEGVALVAREGRRPADLTTYIRRNTSTSTVRTTTRFSQFYARYPKHVRRVKAERAWLKTNAESDTDLWLKIMAGLHRWMKLWDAERRESKYIPHAATFLNERQWEDECELPAPRPTLSPQTEGLVAATAHFLGEKHGETTH